MKNVLFWQGFRSIIPMVPAILPFGLVTSYTAIQSGLTPLQTLLSSFFIFAGASQLVLYQLIGEQAVFLVLVLTVIVINLRMLMYSASLSPHFKGLPRWKRYFYPYLLTDQAYGVFMVNTEDAGHLRHWYYLGAGLSMWFFWQGFILLGLLVGRGIPLSWNMHFTIPLMFLGILALSLKKDRASYFAACVGGITAILLRDLPYNSGLLLGGILGCIAGLLSSLTLFKDDERPF